MLLSSRNSDAVVVTGMGLVTPLGADAASTWRRLLQGETAGEWLLPSLWSRTFIAPEHPWSGCPAVWPADIKERPAGTSKLLSLALLASREAIQDAGDFLDQIPAERRACVIGTSKIDLGPLDSDAVLAGAFEMNGPARCVAEQYDCRAAALCPVAACATGVVSLLRGTELIRQGVADVVLAGGVDASLHPALLASYSRLGVMARPTQHPQRACQPFDENRSGFLVGEGGAVLVLESARHAMARGAKAYGTILGGGLGCDPTGLTLIDQSGERLARFVRQVLKRHDLSPSDIDAISLHGTATRMNDVAESRGLRQALGVQVESIPAFGTKGATGHLMGAAGAVESAIAFMAMRSGILPPTANLVNLDTACRLALSRHSRQGDFRTVLKLSLGFGGHLAAAIFRS